MKLSVKSVKSLEGLDSFIVPCNEKGPLDLGRRLPEAKLMAGVVERGDFKAARGATQMLYGRDGRRWLLLGLGKQGPFSAADWREAAGAAQVALASLGVKKAAFLLPSEAEIYEVGCGLLLSGYRYDRFVTKRKKKAKRMSQVSLVLPETADARSAGAQRQKAEIHASGTLAARDLMCAPGNLANPAYLVERAREIADSSGGRIEVRIKDRKQLQKESFGALLAVGQGSAQEPFLIELDYNPKASRTLALVGKGITFDSGGISLKPGAKMDEMKYDMGGAAAVLGTFTALAKLDLPLRIVGLVPTCENMPSGTAYRPGDIITSRSGQTIEVMNTDAEGRLILADALDYAKTFKPELTVDLATLTGACVIALGHECAAILANGKGEAFYDRLRASGDNTGERVWPMPMFEDYADQIESPVADMRNTGGRPAGTITAAKFLQRFADPMPWIHVDIAGAAWADGERGIRPKGGNGFGVRLLLDFLAGLDEAGDT